MKNSNRAFILGGAVIVLLLLGTAGCFVFLRLRPHTISTPHTVASQEDYDLSYDPNSCQNFDQFVELVKAELPKEIRSKITEERWERDFPHQVFFWRREANEPEIELISTRVSCIVIESSENTKASAENLKNDIKDVLTEKFLKNLTSLGYSKSNVNPYGFTLTQGDDLYTLEVFQGGGLKDESKPGTPDNSYFYAAVDINCGSLKQPFNDFNTQLIDQNSYGPQQHIRLDGWGTGLIRVVVENPNGSDETGFWKVEENNRLAKLWDGDTLPCDIAENNKVGYSASCQDRLTNEPRTITY